MDIYWYRGAHDGDADRVYLLEKETDHIIGNNIIILSNQAKVINTALIVLIRSANTVEGG